MGIDVGYSHTKTVTAKGVDVFRSTIREGAIDVNAKSTVLGYEGQDYTIGESGKITIDGNKVHNKYFELCLLAAILRNADESLTTVNVNLVTGLPVSYYQHQKEQLIDALDGKKVNVKYMGQERVVHIKRVIVFPQSVGMVLLHAKDFSDDQTNLIIDIGGLTVDVSYFEGKNLAKFMSTQKGAIKFHTDLATKISGEFGIDAKHDDAIRFVKKNAVIIDEEPHDFDFDKHFESWMEDIITEIKTSMPYDIVNRKTFVGGGALAFKNYLPKNKGIKTDEVYSNAKAFYTVGVQKFE